MAKWNKSKCMHTCFIFCLNSAIFFPVFSLAFAPRGIYGFVGAKKTRSSALTYAYASH